jgi:16S rRNA (adenine1518-N6/adenine1519-N6)-dimethyltransferase
MSDDAPDGLLGASDVRELAARLGIRPTKQKGQNFVIDGNTVRRIGRTAAITADDVVLEVGPGLGSLTIYLAAWSRHVVAVEIDDLLADALPGIVTTRRPDLADKLTVVHADALKVRELPGEPPTALVANLPYNISVPVILHLLEAFPSIQRVLVMVQLEVADRLAAGPGSKVYGVPSVKARWYGDVARVGVIGRTVFWPAPNVDSGLVAITRTQPPVTTATREEVFAVIDAAFAQRRKTLRAALAGWAGSPPLAEDALRRAGIDPGARGEMLTVTDFAHLAAARTPHHR